jgi:putative membrane protein
MTLLGVLITLAPRVLYATHGLAAFDLSPLADQQLGGVVMLLIGSGTYLAAGVWLLARLLRDGAPRAVRT